MKKYEYKTKGTCSSMITFSLDEEQRVHELAFRGGCDGNLKGIASLCEGQKAEDVIARVSGLTCGRKSTSCPDQLAQALKTAIRQ